ncbi:DNA topoisomerase IB [Actinophytocola sp. NPDC049390]|uniref:DNA topoisomerase IB n=1 Tax=Actinophytocola sp. NPDC049390 TaxID=3363894 RepID=UPI00378DC889
MARRLRRSDPGGPGLRRQRSGRGWRYFDIDDRPLRDRGEVSRLNGLAIPPAWQEVWICPFPNGHIQAVGTDAAGRRQYLYHEQWREERDGEKHDRVVRLAAHLPAFRAAVDEDLCTRGLTERRVLAGALRMLDRGVFRTGGDEYAEESRGVATLLCGDVRVRHGEILFDYVAKGGVERRLRIRDERLAPLITAVRRGRAAADRLLVHRGGEVRASDINSRFQELTGPEYTAKDLRTWHATVLAAVIIAGRPPPSSDTGRRRTEKAVMRAVAEQLGNTPTVTRKSYVDPRVLDGWARGRTVERALRKAAGKSIEDVRPAIERAVVRLLKET